MDKELKSKPSFQSAHFLEVRELTQKLAEGLSDADATVQSMEDASPTKWHLAHTTWFFETVVLRQYMDGYEIFDSDFPYLFNSYYESLGKRHPRPQRGMLTRPSLQKIMDYRSYVNAAMDEFLSTPLDEKIYQLIELGINHEQQHQELLLTDLLHLFAQSPVKPEYQTAVPLAVSKTPPSALNWIEYKGGLEEFGHGGTGFAFDSECPKHQQFVAPFRLASRCVTNGEWIEFIEQGGYKAAILWLSDGLAIAQEEEWEAPLYWEKRDHVWWSMTLRGMQPVDLDAPVTHISYFEAGAYASFVGKRLPTEYEWEHASKDVPIEGNVLASNRLRPAPAKGEGLSQLFGDVWEWTSSPFTPYPGFKIAEGAVGEYNGKFMNGQYVLRGGSCVTPPGHLRATYRNFFHPQKRWQFSGLRLAGNL
ncbi:MAG: ergothioneine biosynthesis protein EgtB [Rhizobiaceae bacterium]|nr:ergothioneine biosynthesis protein EgtB [Rhizobiaceae bacterium]